MKQNPIKLYDLAKDFSWKDLRTKAASLNTDSAFAKEIISKLKSPDSNESYKLIDGTLTCQKGKDIPSLNGVFNFYSLSDTSIEEKEDQAKYHDDEEINERFDEIVLRPFNYNKLHAEVWLDHLYTFGKDIEDLLKVDLSNLTILNCGCGGGFEAQFFAEQGAKVVGFDISQLRAEASAARFALNDLDGFFYRGDALNLPFDDNTFDIVLYHDSLHHVPIQEIPPALKEACRVSKNAVALFEAHDSPIRMVLESYGKSISIEDSGNYTFRFKKSLIQYWCYRFNMELLAYKTRLLKKEHIPKKYAKPIIGRLYYSFNKMMDFFLGRFGNEAFILLKKK